MCNFTYQMFLSRWGLSGQHETSGTCVAWARQILLFLLPLMAKWEKLYLLLCSWESCSAMHVKGEKIQLEEKAKPKILLPQYRVQPSRRKCVWQVARVIWSCVGCLCCVSSAWGIYYVQKAEGCECTVVRTGMGKRIKTLHVQVVFFLLNSLILPWLSLEICRKHFRGHRSMSLPNAGFFCELLRRLENLLWANWPVSMLVVFLELEDLFSIHKLK